MNTTPQTIGDVAIALCPVVYPFGSPSAGVCPTCGRTVDAHIGAQRTALTEAAGRLLAEDLAPAHTCDRRTDGAGTVYQTARAYCPACMAELEAEATEHDRRVIAAGGPVYSSGARNAEAAYVDEHRPA